MQYSGVKLQNTVMFSDVILKGKLHFSCSDLTRNDTEYYITNAVLEPVRCYVSEK